MSLPPAWTSNWRPDVSVLLYCAGVSGRNVDSSFDRLAGISSAASTVATYGPGARPASLPVLSSYRPCASI
jgi:hypothetical protein